MMSKNQIYVVSLTSLGFQRVPKIWPISYTLVVYPHYDDNKWSFSHARQIAD